MDNQNPEDMKDAMYIAIRGVTFTEFYRRRGDVIKFPNKLLFLLTRYADHIRWEDDGMSFTIINGHRVTSILHHLESNDHPVELRSFTKRLGRHGFQRVIGTDTDTWFHELFRRDRLRLNVDIILTPGAEGNNEEGLPAFEEPANRDQQVGDNALPQLANNIHLFEPQPLPSVLGHGGVLLEENRARDHFDVGNNTRNRVLHGQHFQIHQSNEALLPGNSNEGVLVEMQSLLDEVNRDNAHLQQVRTDMSDTIRQLDERGLNHVHNLLSQRLQRHRQARGHTHVEEEGEEEILRYYLQLINDIRTMN